MKTDLFQSCGHCWVFPICWHIECSTFTASSFRIWNSSAGIPSPPLALFIVMLSKAHLTSHTRMWWLTTPLWLSGSWRSFLFSSSVYSFHLFLISAASVMRIRWIDNKGREGNDDVGEYGDQAASDTLSMNMPPCLKHLWVQAWLKPFWPFCDLFL